VADVTYNAIATTETAGEDIPGIRVVKLVSGQIMLADPGDVTEANAVIGVTAGSVTSGNTVKVIRYGPMSDGSWSFTANEKLYLGSSGAITHSVPSSGEVVEIGYAKTSSEIFVNPSSRCNARDSCRGKSWQVDPESTGDNHGSVQRIVSLAESWQERSDRRLGFDVHDRPHRDSNVRDHA
jgi:hypothetical protein